MDASPEFQRFLFNYASVPCPLFSVAWFSMSPVRVVPRIQINSA